MIPHPARRGLSVSMLQLKTATVDLAWRTVTREGTVSPLTETEIVLLKYLASNAGRDIDRDELLAALGRSEHATVRAVDIAITRLRAKLGEPKSPNHIRTVRGIGYRFVEAEENTLTTTRVSVMRRPLRVATGRIDLDRREFVDLGGEAHPLNKLDVELLEQLSSGKVVDREALVRAIWGRGKHDRSLSAALRRLRQRLSDDPESPRVVITVPGGLRLARLDLSTEGRTNLRPDRSPFIDRPELTTLLDALSQNNLVTVRGPAGIGKTRLACEAGLRSIEQDPSREVWFCDLACALAEQGIVSAIDSALGSDPEGDATERIASRLARKPLGTLLILDNFDQVTHLAQTLEEWLRRAPHVRFLVTSRHALGLPSERCLDIGPLSVDAAVTLFVDRAQPAKVDPTDPALQTLVERLDCLPLAVELAAARASEFSVGELLSRLGQRLDWLNRPPAGAASPHRSLRSALDWSWDLLDEDCRRALGQCSVFARTFDLALAREVLTISDPEAALEQLTERSLIDTSSGRFRLFEGIRDYAREKLILSGESSAINHRYAEICLSRAQISVDRVRRTGLVSALADLRALRDDLLAIASRTTTALWQRARAAIMLVPLLQVDGPRHLIRSLCDDLLAKHLPPEHSWLLWTALAEIERLASRWSAAHEALDHALAAASSAGPGAEAAVHRERIFCLVDAGRVNEADPLLQSTLAAVRAGSSEAPVVDLLRYQAKILAAKGDLDRAAAQLDDVIRSVRRIGDPLRLYHLHRDLATVHLARGELDRASACALDSIALAQELGLKRGEFDGRWGLAQIIRQRGDFEQAERLVSDAREGYLSLGEEQRAQLMLRSRALLRLEAGRPGEAEIDLLDAIAQTTEQGSDEWLIIDRANLAIVRHLRGDLAAAIAGFTEIAQGLPRGPFRDAVRAHLAAALADAGRTGEAEEILAQVEQPSLLGPLYRVLAAVVAAHARGARAEALALLAEIEAPAPGGGPSKVLRDQDLHFARRILLRAVHKP